MNLSLKQAEAKERNSSFELLRILSIIMIIGYHYVVHGHFSGEESIQNSILLDLFSSCGKIGVNVFCLLMGYYGIMSHGATSKKVLRTETQVLFYSLLGLAVGLAFDREMLSIKTLSLSFFPTITEHYWFFTAYIIVFSLSGYINSLLRRLCQEDYIKLLFLCYAFWSIIPFFSLRENQGMFWTQLIWFFVMYVTGAYLQLYKPRGTKAIYFFVAIASIFILNISFIVLEFINTYHSIPRRIITYFRWSNSPFSVIASISLLCTAIYSKEYTHKIVNKLASLVFGIYLFHENVFIQDMLWRRILIASTINSASRLIFHFVLSIILIFAAGGLIEFLRSFFERGIRKHLDYFSNKIDFCINSIVSRIISTI